MACTKGQAGVVGLDHPRETNLSGGRLVVHFAERLVERFVENDPERRNGERGGSNAKTILAVLFVAALVFLGVKIVPVYVINYQFQDSMQTEARFALSGYPRKSEDDVREDLWKEAQKQGIPIKKEDIKVSIQQSLVSITLDYSVPIDLKVTEWAPEFHLHADNHTI
jgi:hypothetical protein